MNLEQRAVFWGAPVDSQGERVRNGAILINKLGWQMEVFSISIEITLIKRVGYLFKIRNTSLKDGGWKVVK